MCKSVLYCGRLLLQPILLGNFSMYVELALEGGVGGPLYDTTVSCSTVLVK